MKYLILLLLSLSTLYAIDPPTPKECARIYNDEGSFGKGCAAFSRKDWKVAVSQYRAFLSAFPHATSAEEARFFLGISYFKLGEYDLSNEAFSCYLKDACAPTHFEETVVYKFAIAEKFRCGAKRRIFGLSRLPQCLSAEKEALELYEEVASILPNSDVAAWSLYHRGCMLGQAGDYRESVEAFHSVIRRFPTHPLALDSYIGISYDYLQESKLEANNPDLLCLAMINLKKFKAEFPDDPKVFIVEKQYCEMEEFYALGFFEMAEFYERTDHMHAAYIYYATTIRQFPGTRAACRSKRHLEEWCQ